MTTEQQGEKEAASTYSMHVCLSALTRRKLLTISQVSAKYLELTKKKLELTRLPRELELPEQKSWDQGTPKSVLEPLLDFWWVHISTSQPRLPGHEGRKAVGAHNVISNELHSTARRDFWCLQT